MAAPCTHRIGIPCGAVSALLAFLLVVPSPCKGAVATTAGQCGVLLPGQGFGPNMPGKPMAYAASVADCCAFCHATPGCQWWTWNGSPPGNGNCYAKAANTSGVGSLSMVSGGVTPGPPLPPPPPVRLKLLSLDPVSVTEPTYASWNIDSSCNRGFHRIHFANPNLRAAGLGLAPSRLRFGGSGNDNLVYGLSPGSPECAGVVATTDCGYITPGCLNASHWEALYGFAKGAGAEFIFGVAFGLQQACAAGEGAAYVWNTTNAATLLEYLAAHGQTLYGFELGNEVNNNGGVPCNLTASQQADALLVFAKMVKAKLPSSVLIGPDTGYRDAEDWLKTYLPLVSHGADNILHAVTHHVYPGTSRASFNHPQALDSSQAEIDWYTGVIAALAPGAQVWAGEDGPIGGGNDGTCGENSVCGTFASALWYADDLAKRAKYGFVQYQRQTLFGGAYGLTDTIAVHPQSALGLTEPVALRPGYWVNFLWKRVLGRNVLNATSSAPGVRAYAFTGTPPSKFAAPECAAAGAVQLLLINLNEKDMVQIAPLPPKEQRSPTSKGLKPGEGSVGTWAAWMLSPVVAAIPAAGGRFSNGTQSSLSPFAKRLLLNDMLLPALVDVAGGGANATAFLGQIPVVAVRGAVAKGITLPPLAIAFICY